MAHCIKGRSQDSFPPASVRFYFLLEARVVGTGAGVLGERDKAVEDEAWCCPVTSVGPFWMCSLVGAPSVIQAVELPTHRVTHTLTNSYTESSIYEISIASF